MTVLILHGIQGHAGIHWQQWLHNQLVAQGQNVLMPSLPDADHPDRKTWLKHVHEILQEVDTKQLVLVAHALGVASALDFAEQVGGEAV